MSSIKCLLCGKYADLHFEERILRKYLSKFYYCNDCDYIFVSEPFWLNEAYAESISDEDTDRATRNVFNAIRITSILHFVLGAVPGSKFVDVAGGYGLFTRLMRDIGFDYYWIDKYTKNLFANGFEYSLKNGPCLAISAFEVLEHTHNPKEFIVDCLREFNTDTLIFSTEVFQDFSPPMAADWHYFIPEIGQHISFFSNEGLRRLAKRLELNYYEVGRLKIFTKSKLDLWRIRIAGNRIFSLILMALAARKLGSRRSKDQQFLRAK